MGTEVEQAVDSLSTRYESTQRAMATIAEMKESPRRLRKEDVVLATTDVVLAAFEWVTIKRSGHIYYRNVGTRLYRRVDSEDFKEIVRQIYCHVWGRRPSADTLASTVDTVRDNIGNVIDHIDNRYVEVAPTLLWDSESGTLQEVPDSYTPDVFRKLFDSSSTSDKVVQIPPLTQQQSQYLMGVYKETLSELNDHKPKVKNDVVYVWTDDNPDIYFDIMKCFASIFTKNKPLGCFILIGDTRNGKSTFRGMVRTMLGSNNCTAVQLTAIGDWHYMHQLNDTMFNMPDEEEDTKVKSQSDFKTIADHGELDVATMYSHTPLKLLANFTCVFPMNHFPDFEGAGAAACVKRCLALPFNRDLSSEDNKSDKFEEKTYTPKFMAELVGEVLAYATYYSSHNWEFSPTLERERERVEEEASSGSVYRRIWEKHFCGFQNYTLLYNDYKAWATLREVKIMKKKDFKIFWNKYLSSSRTTYTVANTGEKIKVYKIPSGEDNNLVMLEKSVCPISKKILSDALDEYDLSTSLIYELEQQEEEKWT